MKKLQVNVSKELAENAIAQKHIKDFIKKLEKVLDNNESETVEISLEPAQPEILYFEGRDVRAFQFDFEGLVNKLETKGSLFRFTVTKPFFNDFVWAQGKVLLTFTYNQDCFEFWCKLFASGEHLKLHFTNHYLQKEPELYENILISSVEIPAMLGDLRLFSAELFFTGTQFDFINI